jgi:hypothetical protein
VVNEAGTFPGVVDDKDAGPIEDDVTNQLISQLVTPLNAEGNPGHVAAIRFAISRTHNFLSRSASNAILKSPENSA